MKNFSEILLKQADDKWNEFCAILKNSDISICFDSQLTQMLKSVFVLSDFVAKIWFRNPEVLKDLLETGDLLRSYDSDEYIHKIKKHLKNVTQEDELSSILRQFRRREMTRIACRDLCHLADLGETMIDLSVFADVCIDSALSLLYEWHCSKWGTPCSKYGRPQHLVVIGMGKLGAYELNFSSDIDLIFAYPEAGATKDGSKSIVNDDFFMRLCRRLIHVLGANTFEGIVFRVDMNLRPYGESGPLVMNFDALESYYHEQGREWERYAWIKARPVAGDKESGKKLLTNLNPFVFRRYLDYGVFESIRDMKQSISLDVLRKGMKDNIKLGPGGIREVEFFGQVFQLLRGGIVTILQKPAILEVLSILAQEKYIEQKVCNQLHESYIFLRNTEHRLQEFADAQTHQLPKDSLSCERLGIAMGFKNWEDFYTKLQLCMNIVHKHFNNLLKQDDSDSENEIFKSVWQYPSDDEENINILLNAGFKNPENILKILKNFRSYLESQNISSQGRERIDRLIPFVIIKTGKSKEPEKSLDRIINLINAIRQRTSYVSLLLENPDALDHLVRLAGTSAWIINFLTRHPVLLDELLDPRTLYRPPKKASLEKELSTRLSRIDSNDLEYQMDELRIFKQIKILRVAAADISDSMPLMKVSDYLSDIAEIIMDHVLDISWNHLIIKHGLPTCDINIDCRDRGFAVIAYGKLGGLELGYDSDLDMVFLHSGTSGYTKGERSIDNTTFFARLGQRVLHILSSHTGTGKLYEPDMRLRPSGSSGILVCHIDTFREYQLKDAWTWEKQALIRARSIVGDEGLKHKFKEIRNQVLAVKRDKEKLCDEIRQMRIRMKNELLKSEPGMFDLKQGSGGIVDIEFLVQYLVLLNAYKYPQLLDWTDNVRLIKTLADTGIIDDLTAYLLRRAYLVYRAVGHKLSLQEKPAIVSDNRFPELRQQVEVIWKKFIN